MHKDPLVSELVNNTITERELLYIVETLKELRNIRLGEQIKVYTYRKNLTYKSFNTESYEVTTDSRRILSRTNTLPYAEIGASFQQ